MGMDAHFFKPFVDGTREILRVQCFTEAKPLKPFVKRTGPKVTFDIAGVIALNSAAFTGSIALCFPAAVFLGLMSKMLSEEFKTITPDMQDGAAELLNMIFGHAKRILNEQNYKIDKAIPTVIRGEKMELQHLSTSPVMVIPFETPLGVFHVEIVAEDQLT
jgi:chemotaxis protein CheX